MTLRAYRPSDLEEMNSWYVARGLSPLPAEAIPKNGFIEPGVAAGFLCLTEVPLAFLEGYISNPQRTSQERGKALDEITVELVEAAKALGKSRVMALTQEESLAMRCLLLGFKSEGAQTMLILGE